MLKSQRLGDFLPEALNVIKTRCERNPHNKDFKPTSDSHKQRVITAVSDFLYSKSGRPKRDKKRRRRKIGSRPAIKPDKNSSRVVLRQPPLF